LLSIRNHPLDEKYAEASTIVIIICEPILLLSALVILMGLFYFPKSLMQYSLSGLSRVVLFP
jgi:hypothetical protein